MHPHTNLSEPLNGCPDIHSVTPQAIKLGHHQDISSLQAIHQAREPRAVAGGYGTADRLLYGPPSIDREASRFDLSALVVCGLVSGGDTAVSKDTGHDGLACTK